MLELTVKNFNDVVKNTDKTVILDFWAPWCGPCKQQAPVLEKLSKDENYLIGKINVDEENDLTLHFEIMSIPTLIYMKNGEVVLKKTGFQPESVIKEQLASM